MQRGGLLSEFYEQRRTSIKDGVALIAFIVGWFAAAPFGWPYIARGFDDDGNAATGVLKFLLIVFAAGVLSGAAGLALGDVLGRVWERIHRRRRRAHGAVIDRSDESAAATASRETSERVASRVPLPALRFDTSVTAAGYLALLHLVSPGEHDVARGAKALARTTNIGAWHDGRLVGVVRVLTDGYFYAALADIVVDPAYQRRGLGTLLMNKAYDATPRGTLFVNAQHGTAAFFEHVGCERGTPGFVMRRTSERVTGH